MDERSAPSRDAERSKLKTYVTMIESTESLNVNAEAVKLSPELEAMFWAKVDKSEECWVWTGEKHAEGYGVFWLWSKRLLAHRVAWLIAHGEWPCPCCLHKCDNRPCVRPDHLFQGTRADNVADMYAKGRARLATTGCLVSRGEEKWNAKLTADGVKAIRALHASGTISGRNIARLYGVSPCTIRRVVHSLTWRHV